MEWCKLYATFATDPKIADLSDRAFRAYVEAMCYATLHETDGAIFFRNKGTEELERVGLLDVDDDGRRRIHGWLGRQRSKADVDAKRIAGRNAARTRWANAEPKATPNTEVEVEVEVEREVEQAKTPTAYPSRPNESQVYFAQRLNLTIPAVQKLNTKYGVEHVTEAMRQVHGSPPEGGVANVYAYVESVASFKKAGAA